MRRSYLIAAILLLLLALAAGANSLTLRYYTPLGPGPGFFPFWLSVALGATSLAMLLQAALRPQEPAPADYVPSRGGMLKIGAVLLAMAGTIVLLGPLGFRLTTFLMYLFLLWSLGERSWFRTPVVALAGSFGVYHAFVHWLNVPLPVGILGI